MLQQYDFKRDRTEHKTILEMRTSITRFCIKFVTVPLFECSDVKNTPAR